MMQACHAYFVAGGIQSLIMPVPAVDKNASRSCLLMHTFNPLCNGSRPHLHHTKTKTKKHVKAQQHLSTKTEFKRELKHNIAAAMDQSTLRDLCLSLAVCIGEYITACLMGVVNDIVNACL